MTAAPHAAPLSGLKVVELGIAMAGPFCGMMLGDYGADVIKIERIDHGDESRHWSPFFTGGLSHYFAAANRNKRSLELDLKSDEGRDILRRLVADADVVIDNFRIGVLDKLGLGYEALSGINPGLIYCSISGYGATGPRAHDPANDILMQAFAGSMSVTGEDGGGPAKAGISIADLGGGMFGTIGVLLALAARTRTGKGQRVDTSLLEGQIAMLSYHLTYFFASGAVPVRQGASMQLSVAYRAFRAADDWLIVGAFTDRMWEGVCRVTGFEKWLTDPRYQTSSDRAEHRHELIAELECVFAKRPVAAWIEALAAEGVPATPIQTIDRIVRDPQVLAREMVVTLPHKTAGDISMAGLPIKLSDNPGALRVSAPLLGEHTHAILKDLGFTEPDIAGLVERRVVGSSGT